MKTINEEKETKTVGGLGEGGEENLGRAASLASAWELGFLQ